MSVLPQDPISEPCILDVVVRWDGDVATLVLRGEMDHHSASKLETVGASALAVGATSVVVDCAALSFMDSGGLQVLIALAARTAERGGGVIVRQPSPVVRRVLAVSGVDQLVQVV